MAEVNGNFSTFLSHLVDLVVNADLIKFGSSRTSCVISEWKKKKKRKKRVVWEDPTARFPLVFLSHKMQYNMWQCACGRH